MQHLYVSIRTEDSVWKKLIASTLQGVPSVYALRYSSRTDDQIILYGEAKHIGDRKKPGKARKPVD